MNPDARNLSAKPIASAFVFQIVALIVAGWFHRHALNPDGVAYLRIASYCVEGRIDLAISGYWGPLISWLIAPWLKAGFGPLVAARIVMGLSAVFFLSGCLRLFRAFGFSGRLLTWGVWTCAIVSVPWSVENITPDLLLAGLVSFAFAPMVTDRWFEQAFVAFGSGVAWGVAYLCKAIALPLGCLVIIGMTLLWWRKRAAPTPVLARNLVLALVGITVIAAPWIRVMSIKYGTIRISDSARLNHSLVGPRVSSPVYLLDRGFHRPEPGRITIWEDPAMPYPDWSPLASWSNAWRQLRIMAWNVPVVLTMLTSLNLAFPLLAGCALWRWRGGRTDRRSGESATGLTASVAAALPIAALSVLFLPNYLLVTEQRYFYPVFALLFIASAAVLFPKENPVASPRWIQRYGVVLLLLAFVLPTFGRIWLRPGSTSAAGDCAFDLAGKIRAAGLSGPVAGSGKMPGGRAGLYLAFLLEEPWFGDEPGANAASYMRSGAGLIVVNRGSVAARELKTNPWFHNLDPQLFDSTGGTRQFPLQVFQNLSGSDPNL